MKCTAHSSRTGKPCKLNAIIGGTVCQVHGGRAPQVKRKAAERVAELRDIVFDRLAQALGALSAEQLQQLQGDPRGIKALVDSVVKLSEHYQLLIGSPTERTEVFSIEAIDAEIARLSVELEGRARLVTKSA
jgi:hypothetical protein